MHSPFQHSTMFHLESCHHDSAVGCAGRCVKIGGLWFFGWGAEVGRSEEAPTGGFWVYQVYGIYPWAAREATDGWTWGLVTIDSSGCDLCERTDSGTGIEFWCRCEIWRTRGMFSSRRSPRSQSSPAFAMDGQLVPVPVAHPMPWLAATTIQGTKASSAGSRTLRSASPFSPRGRGCPVSVWLCISFFLPNPIPTHGCSEHHVHMFSMAINLGMPPVLSKSHLVDSPLFSRILGLRAAPLFQGFGEFFR